MLNRARTVFRCLACTVLILWDISSGYAETRLDNGNKLDQQPWGQCLKISPNVTYSESMIVELSVELYEDGNVESIKVVDQGQSTQDEEFVALAEKLKTEIIRCAPYNLPINLYKDWQTSIWRFDPSTMFGQ